MGRRRNVDGRELLLNAALKLFAEQGVDGVSIRAVNREAGLGPGATHYHFGTKEALVDTVMHTFGDSVTEDVESRAKRIVSSGTAITARDLVMMLCQPCLDLMAVQSGVGAAWLKLLSQLMLADPDFVVDRTAARWTSRAARKAYPNADRRTLDRAIRMCFILLATQLAHSALPRARSADVGILTDFLAGGLEATLGNSRVTV